MNDLSTPSLYRDRTSFLHGLAPFSKLILTGSMIAAGFIAPGLLGPPAVFLLLVVPAAVSGRVLRAVIRGTLRTVLPFGCVLFLVYGVLMPHDGGERIDLGIAFANRDGIRFAWIVGSKVAVMAASLLLLMSTTRPEALVEDLSARGLPAPAAYICLAGISLIPRLRARAAAIADAQRARGLSAGSSLISRCRALAPLVIPLLLGAVADVEDRAVALEIRAFNAKGPKTRLAPASEKTWEPRFRRAALLPPVLLAGIRLWPLLR